MRVGKDWTDSEIFAKTLNLDQVKEEIGKHPALFEDVIGSCSTRICAPRSPCSAPKLAAARCL